MSNVFDFRDVDLLGAAWLPPASSPIVPASAEGPPLPPALFTDDELREASREEWQQLKDERGWLKLPEQTRQRIAKERHRLKGNAGVERRRRQKQFELKQLRLDNAALRHRQRALLQYIASLEKRCLAK